MAWNWLAAGSSKLGGEGEGEGEGEAEAGAEAAKGLAAPPAGLSLRPGAGELEVEGRTKLGTWWRCEGWEGCEDESSSSPWLRMVEERGVAAGDRGVSVGELWAGGKEEERKRK
jgi:hypothetical protein